jgi:hypothetical protein
MVLSSHCSLDFRELTKESQQSNTLHLLVPVRAILDRDDSHRKARFRAPHGYCLADPRGQRGLYAINVGLILNMMKIGCSTTWH